MLFFFFKQQLFSVVISHYELWAQTYISNSYFGLKPQNVVDCFEKSYDWRDTAVFMKDLNFLLEAIEEVATYILLSAA